MVRIIYGPKSEEVTRRCRKLHHEELYSLLSSPSNITVIKSKRV